MVAGRRAGAPRGWRLMSARRSRRRSRRRRSLLILLGFAVAAAAIAGYVWRSAQPPPSASHPRHASPGGQPPQASADEGGEDFSASERQGLADVLKRRSAGKQP